MAGDSNERSEDKKPELRPKPRLSQQQLDDIFERRKSLRNSTEVTTTTTVVTLRRTRRAVGQPEVTVL